MNVDCNFVAAESWDDGMPERLRWIRDNDPVYWSEQTKLWMVTSYADAKALAASSNKALLLDFYTQW